MPRLNAIDAPPPKPHASAPRSDPETKDGEEKKGAKDEARKR